MATTYVITAIPVRTPGSPAPLVGGFNYEKGWTGPLSGSQVSALTGAGYTVRAMNNPGAGTQTTTYLGGATLTSGTNPASGTHDTLGEAAGASN